jgi:hypothetical protein
MANNINEEAVDIVLRQTTLSRDEVIERLSKNENNYLNVIEEFMGINKNKQKNIITVNQQIYKEIRSVMDGAANNFRNNVNVIR